LSRFNANPFSWFAAAMLGLVAISAPLSSPARASSECASPHAPSAYTRLGSRELYRFQARPGARLPTGAAVNLRAPAGMTEAELHGALLCGAVWNSDDRSPLTVPGAKLSLRRTGSVYEVQITADEAGAAREIQRRVAALR
jgi:hypothetical protein